ncbi:hypothetical protein TNCV_403811 [Trichonephila clavipes]|nr:hypothetical protein TNCV_403811 [Trichonephila clavipes]
METRGLVKDEGKSELPHNSLKDAENFNAPSSATKPAAKISQTMKEERRRSGIAWRMPKRGARAKDAAFLPSSPKPSWSP